MEEQKCYLRPIRNTELWCQGIRSGDIVTMEQPTNTPESVTPMPDDVANLLQQLPEDLRQGVIDIYEAEHQHPNWTRTMIPLILHHLSGAQQATTAQPPPNQGSETVISPTKEASAAYRKVSELRAIPEYKGDWQNDAARKWIREVERYFRDETALTDRRGTDVQRIMVAASAFKGTAFDRWERHCRGVDSGIIPAIQTMDGFFGWVQRNFREYLNAEKRWERWSQAAQGNRGVQAFASDLADLASDLHLDIGEPVPMWLLIRTFISGAKTNLRAAWAKEAEEDRPTTFEGVVEKFIQYEHGFTISNHVNRKAPASGESSGGDPMDIDTGNLNALASRPNPPKKSSPAWRSWCQRHQACFNCGKRGHSAKECNHKASVEAGRANKNPNSSNESEKGEGH